MNMQIQLTDVDIRKFAQNGGQAEGELRPEQLPRVMADTPASHLAELRPFAWRAQGLWRDILGQTVPYTQSGVMGQPWLALQLHGEVIRTCQRCLEPLRLALDLQPHYRFVADEATAAEQDETCEEDVLVWSRHFNVLELLEDEVLLAIPLTPMHEDCELTPHRAGDLPDIQEPEEVERPNPFAALEGLKGKLGGDSA